MNISTTAALKQRIAAAIRGAFIADASSMGTHWIYDPSVMAKSVPSMEEPEFKNPPTPNFYSSEDFPGHYAETGMLSPYGEQLLFVTEYVGQTMNQDFTGEGMSQAMLEWAKSFGGRPDGALKTFVENMEKEDNSGKWPNCGADDHEAHIYMKIVPVVCRFCGSSDLIPKVREAILVHQNNQKAVAFGIISARLLEAVLLGAPLSEALATIEANIEEELETSDHKQEVLDAFVRGKKAGQKGITLDQLLKEVSNEIMKDKPDSPFYNLAGRSCALPGSFIGPIALFYKATARTDGDSAFVHALRENILASGDTCSRAVFAGSILAASGVGNSKSDAKWSNAIPSSWTERMHKGTMDKIDRVTDVITSSITLSAE